MLGALNMVRSFLYCTGGGATGFHASVKQLFLLPSLVTMTIAATRIYRSLSHFASPPITYEIIFIQIVFTLTGLCHRSVNDSNPSWQRGSRLVSTNKDTAAVHIP